MTKEQAEDLVTEAKTLIYKELRYSHTKYKFTQIGNIVAEGEDGKFNYKVNGTLETISTPKSTIFIPLSRIVELIKTQTS